MPDIKLNITCANVIIRCFTSGMIFSLIAIIHVFILDGTINFNIVDTSTLFFFYLKSMNIFAIYLNNITNQFISQDSKSILIICK